jgi:farnesyl diphosphate synthase
MAMSFEAKLAQAATAVDAYFGVLLADQTSGSAGGAHATPPRLAAAMRHAVLAGGKRFRPFLVLETAALFGVDDESATPFAAALECIHCYSLAHDDLPAMDNDALRRGQPSVWKAFDEWTAILAGDALLTLAFEIISSHGDLPASARNDMVLSVARASGPGGMVGGQCLDLAAEKITPGNALTAVEIEHLAAMKTGALIACACEIGAIIGNADRSERDSLLRYGRALGLAFQIADDLLDAEGEAAVVGKATAKDADKGKATLVSHWGIAGARHRLAEMEAAAIAALGAFGVRADTLAAAARFASRRQS